MNITVFDGANVVAQIEIKGEEEANVEVENGILTVEKFIRRPTGSLQIDRLEVWNFKDWSRVRTLKS